jgi:hypothetical protein
MSKGSGLSRSERRRNAWRERLRALAAPCATRRPCATPHLVPPWSPIFTFYQF